jgi:DNA-binding LacI/PurR family transcriptional regulator
VSVATVSRSFSAPNTVATATRERLLAVAAELHYEPNRAARGLITGRTGNVGVIVPDLGNPYFHGVLKGAQARARRADYAVFVADGQESATEEEALINAMRKQVDGIVLCSSRLPAAKLATLDHSPTVVLLNRRAPGRASVVVDSADGMKQAVRHLAELGHRRCVFVSGPRRSWSNQQRRRGLRAAARAHGIEYVVLGPVAPQFQSGVEWAERVLETGTTAVVAYNDLVAVGILSRLAELGVRVPEQLSVVGFDDIPLAAMVIPPLTTVSLPTMRAGEAAVDVLLERLQSRGSVQPTARKLPATLIVRSTTGRPPRRSKRTGGPLSSPPALSRRATSAKAGHARAEKVYSRGTQKLLQRTELTR